MKLTKREKFLACVLLALGAIAWGPDMKDKFGDYKSVSGATWGAVQSLATADTEEDWPDDFGSGDLCVPFGSLVVAQGLTSGSVTNCVWAMTDDVTFTNANGPDEDSCHLTDANGDNGDGACFMLVDRVPVEQTITYEQVKSAIGARTGICSAPKAAWRRGPMVYPPCRIDADCATAFGITGATCDTSLSANDMQRLSTQGCAVLKCGADTNATSVHIRVEK